MLLTRAEARRSAVQMSEHPLRKLFIQSQLPFRKLVLLWSLAECVLFFIHELMFHLVTVCILIKMTQSLFLAIFFTIAWIVLCTNIYIISNYKELLKKWSETFLCTKKIERRYLFHVLIISGSLSYICIYYLLTPLINKAEVLQIDVDQNFFNHISVVIKSIFLEHGKYLAQWVSANFWLLYLVALLLIFYFMVKLILFWTSPADLQIRRQNLVIGSETIISRLYLFIAKMLYPKNPWIWRDILLIDRLQKYWTLPIKSLLLFPPPIISFVVFSSFFMGRSSQFGMVVSLWLLALVHLFNTTWVWLVNYPVLHPSSESRQIDLVHLSPCVGIKAFMRSKWKLLTILLLPFQLFVTFFLILGLCITHASWVTWITGLVGIWLIFFIVSIFSIYWATILPSYRGRQLFQIRMDTYEQKFVQLFYRYPKWFLSYAMLLAFFMVNFSNHHQDQNIMELSFIFLICTFLVSVGFYFRMGHKKPTDES
jgi:hypothetical protein